MNLGAPKSLIGCFLYAVGKKNMQEIIENSRECILVNASFLHDPRSETAMNFDFMDGIEFPGLWSRDLYDDQTPTKKYRNMLVDHRPTFSTMVNKRMSLFECPKDEAGGWALMLHGARMHMNTMLQTQPDTLLSEFDTILTYALNYWNNYPLQEPPRRFDAKHLRTITNWMKPVQGGSRYDQYSSYYILPRFLGTTCGVTVINGFCIHPHHLR
jgi:hypothetical protein